MLPSTDLKASAPRIIAVSVLHSPAHPCRYRRFACPLAGADARLAEKLGSVTPSFRGTFTPYLLPVRLAHQTRRHGRVPPPLQASRRGERRRAARYRRRPQVTHGERAVPPGCRRGPRGSAIRPPHRAHEHPASRFAARAADARSPTKSRGRPRPGTPSADGA